jgi:hypothetical protein
LIERSINTLKTSRLPSRPRSQMTNIEREIVIHLCQRFWSQIEAVVEATGVFIT